MKALLSECTAAMRYNQHRINCQSDQVVKDACFTFALHCLCSSATSCYKQYKKQLPNATKLSLLPADSVFRHWALIKQIRCRLWCFQTAVLMFVCCKFWLPSEQQALTKKEQLSRAIRGSGILLRLSCREALSALLSSSYNFLKCASNSSQGPDDFCVVFTSCLLPATSPLRLLLGFDTRYSAAAAQHNSAQQRLRKAKATSNSHHSQLLNGAKGIVFSSSLTESWRENV